MKLVKQGYEFVQLPTLPEKLIERVGRTCYKSESNITHESAEKFTGKLVASEHLAMIEFADIIVKFTTNRGVSHEIVRHRHCSFAQESTRYVRYSGDMEFIEPMWWRDSNEKARQLFLMSCTFAETNYKELLYQGCWSPQMAREVLPNSLKTELNVKANIREWRHIFNLRCDKASHPQMYDLMRPLLTELSELYPVLFGDITFKL